MNKHIGNRDYVINRSMEKGVIYPCMALTKCDESWEYCKTCSLSLNSSVSLGNYYYVNELSTNEVEVIVDKVIDKTTLLIVLGD